MKNFIGGLVIGLSIGLLILYPYYRIVTKLQNKWGDFIEDSSELEENISNLEDLIKKSEGAK